MKIDRVCYEATFNLGNFENEKIRLEAEVEENETPDTVVSDLRQIAIRTSVKLRESGMRTEGNFERKE